MVSIPVLECVEDVQTVVLVEFEASFLLVRLAVVVSRLGRRILEERGLQLLVLDDSFVERLSLLRGGGSLGFWPGIEAADIGVERELLHQGVLSLSGKHLIFDE